MQELTLYIGNKNYSSWSLRAWLFMKQHGLEFAEYRIPLDEPDTADTLARISPTRQVPVLRDGDVLVWESLAICEYLAATRELPAWPTDRAAQAWARASAHEMHSGFAALRAELPMNCRAQHRRVQPSAAAAADIERVLNLWTSCRQAFADHGPWLVGELSIADAMYAPVALRFGTYGIPMNDDARDYAAHLFAQPALREWVDAAAQETETIDKEEVGLG